ncbi:MAG: acetyl-CoA carboxylase biotin carboxyl carrier protein [candidate division KSB1 bacterium]
MNVEEIKQLVKIVAESDIADLEVTQWGRKVKITKYAANAPANSNHMSAPFYMREPIYHHTLPGPPPPSAPPLAVPPSASLTLAAQDTAPPAAEKLNTVDIKSPMVGTFYRAPAPDAEPYANEGSVIQKGQALCLIEAMKLMNEIEADFSCKIVEILVQNAQPVEYNQPLFRVVKI